MFIQLDKRLQKKYIPRRIKAVSRWLCNKEKERIIAKALKTPEGREALAKAMLGPIRKSMI